MFQEIPELPGRRGILREMKKDTGIPGKLIANG
jgi:hypothetical protein